MQNKEKTYMVLVDEVANSGQQSIKRTLERRPDLLAEANLSKKEQKYLEELKESTCK